MRWPKNLLIKAVSKIKRGDFEGAASVLLKRPQNLGFDLLFKSGHSKNLMCQTICCGNPTEDGLRRRLALKSRAFPVSARENLRTAAKQLESAPLFGLLGAVDILSGNLEKARESFSAAIQLNPSWEWPRFASALGETFLAPDGKTFYQKIPECLQNLDRVLESNPAHLEALRLRCILRKDLEDYGGAREDLERILNIVPSDRWAHSELAELFCDVGNFKESWRHIEAIKGARKSGWYWAFRGRAQALSGRHKEGLESLRRAARLSPGFAPIRAWLGEALRKNAFYAEALKEFGEAIRLDPEFIYAFEWRGRLLLMLGRYREALKDLEINARKGWRHYYAFAFRGEAYFKLGLFERASHDFDRAHPLNMRQNWNPRVEEGRKPGSKETAYTSDLDEAAGKHPQNPWVWALRGRARAIDGTFQFGVSDLTRSLTLKKSLFAYKWRGFAFLKAELPQLALADLMKAGGDPWARAWRGCALASLNRHSEAMIEFNAVLKRGEPRFSEVYAWKAKTLESLGRFREAALERAKSGQWLRLNQGSAATALTASSQRPSN